MRIACGFTLHAVVNAVPVTFKVNGEQYVIVPVGWGGAFRLWSPSTMMVTPTSKYGPSRLVAFKLGGRQPFPLPAIHVPEVPHPPAQTYTAEQVKQGAALALSTQHVEVTPELADSVEDESLVELVVAEGGRAVLVVR